MSSSDSSAGSSSFGAAASAVAGASAPAAILGAAATNLLGSCSNKTDYKSKIQHEITNSPPNTTTYLQEGLHLISQGERVTSLQSNSQKILVAIDKHVWSSCYGRIMNSQC